MPFDYTERRARPRRYRRALSPASKAFDGIDRRWRSTAPLDARHWLQASNPSERWKWDFMFQDLPPVKGAVDPSSLPLPPGAIALKEVK